jgi:uncharacterized protein YgiB involved in biofilm formation
MKRSRSIKLVLVGSVSLLALTACDQSDVLTQNDFFQDEKQCEAKFDADACRQALADARQQHVKTAPAFANREECEAQFGAENCIKSTEIAVPPATGSSATSTTPSTTAPTNQASAGGGWFMPVMMGYMMGQMMGGRMSGQPLYRDTDNRAFSGNKPMGRFDSASMPPPRAATSSIARGGFGRSATGTVSS